MHASLRLLAAPTLLLLVAQGAAPLARANPLPSTAAGAPMQPSLQPSADRPGLPPGQLCRAAIAVAEREFGLPAGLLAAIGRVESGRREGGRTDPYPWTINAEGRGSMFPSKPAAIAAVQALQAGGMRSIDIGCMQINLRHHPDAFASLEQAFDPLANARYAARFLTELYAPRQDWARAAAAYHSQTPEYAAPYLARVQAAWEVEKREAPMSQGQAMASLQGAAGGPPGPGSIGSWGAPAAVAPAPGGGWLNNGAERAQIRAAAPGTVGRGLDAYRSAPIPLAGGTARPLVAAASPAPAPGAVAGRRLF
ncbi:lytic transglycosylase domain-containing protein [Pseudoroseomonas cervicalis]|uniref:lytic transglycosylase domain-containing protein n=1 Tax=Teichococcus cervicalis TaxID=204525 RepID=UPI0022F19806|nr:lytic transglycosylase domain-containing protein [Pseudoroseomonas cervicalis]WBV44562.1 lytic transglycosylase domain-containing protein [Pseudoroseomonas cervicalis]